MPKSTDSQDKKKSALDLWLSKSKKVAKNKGIEKMPENEASVLSHGQERLWLIDQLYPKSRLYNYVHHYKIEGGFDVKILIESFQLLFQQNDILKTNYELKEGVCQQLVKHKELLVEQIDLSALSPSEQQTAIEKKKELLLSTSFDLSEDSLFCLTTFKLSEESYELYVVMHHIIGDAWSMSIINEQVSSFYEQLKSRETPVVDQSGLRYRDFAYWQRQQEVKDEDLQYWKDQFSGDLSALNLPKRHASNTNTFLGNTYKQGLSAELSESLKRLAKEQQTTLYVVLLSAYKVLLSKYCNQSDIIVGSPFSNRDTKELEGIIGFFNETLALRTQLSADLSFTQLIEKLKKTTIDAMAHKNVPFDTLVNELKIERESGENPLFQTMFLYNGKGKKLDLGDTVQVSEQMLDLGVSKFDLTLFVNETKESHELAFEYSESLEAKMVQSMSQHFENLLKDIISTPDKSITELSIFSKEEYNEIIYDWNDTELELPKVNSIQELIFQEKHSNQIAVSFQDKSITYDQLNKWSSQLAVKLQEKGVQKNEFVGLYTNRSLEMIVGMMAILKSGAAYLPLDPEYPNERLEFMLNDTSAKIVLKQAELQSELNANELEVLDISPLQESEAIEMAINKEPLPDRYAYVIYTSGSTGKPKGVPVSHRNLLHSTTSRFHFYEDPLNSFLLLSSFSFDSSVAGIFWSLCSGGKLVLPPHRIEQDVEALSDLIEKEKVSHSLMLPSLYLVLLGYANREKLASLTAIAVAGESCPPSLLENHFEKLPDVKLYNEYGPTEASVWCIAHQFEKHEEYTNVPIGKPIPNAKAYVLDAFMQPVPQGVNGELYIGGKGITGAYLNRPELSKEKFLPNPFETNEKLYRTGDLVRYRKNGVIDFLGRVDSQVKIRGHRVELEEIRSLILQRDSITEAVVVVQEQESNKSIIAYLESNEQNIKEVILSELKTQLPPYMIPASIVMMQNLPKLPNGKVNTKQLPSVEAKNSETSNYVAASTEEQKALVAIWEEVLGLDKVGVKNNFFDIGGDSIRSIQIVAKARAEGWQIGPTQIFEHQTIEELAQHIQKVDSTYTITEEEEEYPIQLPLSYQQQAFLFHSLQSENDQGQLQLEFEISGAINTETFQKAWERVIELHPILRTSIHWEKLEESYQEIHAEATINWSFEDLSTSGAAEQETALNKIRANEQNEKLDLSLAGCSRIKLIKQSDSEFILLWSCHHILIDGWSAAIILEDTLKAYDALVKKKKDLLSPVPSFKSYNNWKSKQNEEEAKTYWKELLNNTSSPLFSNFNSGNDFQDKTVFLEAEVKIKLSSWLKKERLTLNTVMQGLWMICLSRYFNHTNIGLGLTVSGRSSDFNGIDRITGLLMNVLPFKKEIDPEKRAQVWLQELQDSLSQMRALEYIDSDKIKQWFAEQGELFDSLFVFGNFMKEKTEIGGLTVEGFTGGFSSTYPLTVRVNPDANFEINFRYNAEALSEKSVDWLCNAYLQLIHSLLEKADSNNTVNELLASLPETIREEKLTQQIEVSDEAIMAQNPTQLKLSKIWESLLNVRFVDINSNYFDLGGTSLGAIQLFTEIEKEFGKKLPPTTLINHPSIAKLAELISGGKTETWSSLVAMKTSGTKPPLFCIHSGGAHVLFYKGIAKHINKDYPVYAIQPSGIDGEEEFHLSIAAMAEDYIKEMKKIQPEGPYHLIGTCFGNAVGLEMIHQLKAQQEEIALFFVVDSAPAYLIPPSPNGEKKPVSRMMNMVAKGNWNGIVKKFRNRYIRFSKKQNASKRSEQEIELDEIIDSLNDLYVKYTWKPTDEQIVLIRSSEFANKKDKKFHLERWEHLSNNKLISYTVDGHHISLFEEPEVQGLTETISKKLLELN